MIQPTRRQAIVGGAAALVAPLVANLPLGCSAPAVEPNVTISPTSKVAKLQWGWTQVDGSLLGDSAAVARAAQIVQAAGQVGSTHVFPWGNPDPVPTQTGRNWSGLDDRVSRCLAGLQPHIALAVCPTLWSAGKLYYPPTTDHVNDFVGFCGEVAARYPNVGRYSFWSEMRNMWDSTNNRWDNPLYVRLYDLAYQAVLAANPNAVIAGPYCVLLTTPTRSQFSVPQTAGYPVDPNGQWYMDGRAWGALLYWLQHRAVPAGWADHQAIAIELSSGNTSAPSGSPNIFGIVTNAIRGLPEATYPGCTSLPIWATEWYSYAGPAPRSDSQDAAGMIRDMVCTMIYSDLSLALLWQQQAFAGSGSKSFPLALHTSTRDAGGGQPTELTPWMIILRDHFGLGTEISAVTGPPGVWGVASPQFMLLVNASAAAVDVVIQHRDMTLESRTLQAWERALLTA